MATTQQPPRQQGAGAAAGTAAAGGVAGTAAAGVGAEQGAEAGLGIVAGAAKAGAVAAIVAALVAFLARKRTLDEAYLRAQLTARGVRPGAPPVAPSVIDELVAEEQRRDEAFALKQSERVMTESNRILGIADPEERRAAMRKLAEQERRYAQQRAEAMAARAIASLERVVLHMDSPQGAFWLLDPTVNEHTKGCLVMGGAFWPWEVLDRVHPPRHPGCPCRLVGYAQAIRDGLMTAGEVPNVRQAVARAAHVLMEAEPDAPEVEALQELLDEYEGRAEEGPPDGEGALRAALIEAGLTTPEAFDEVAERYNPAEPRDPRGRWARLSLKGAKALTKPQALAAAKRVVADVAADLGHKGAVPPVEVRRASDMEGGFVAGLRNGSIVVTEHWLDEAKSADYGVHAFRQIGHEAMHALASGEPRVKGENSKMIEEGGVELLSLDHWHRRGQPYGAPDAARVGGKWVEGVHAMAVHSVYQDYTAELLRRAASRVGWDRTKIRAEVRRVLGGDHNARLDFRDGSKADHAPPKGVAADAVSLIRWYLGDA